jgi:para-aminobenzoate synthetase/4-amino-4-deoxychorismate lyase
MACFALLDDCAATAAAPSSRLYTGFLREHRCADPQALEAVWAAVESDLRAGGHAVLLADYEWGARLRGAGDGGLAPADAGALRILIFARLARLSADEVAAWLQAQEADPGKDGTATAGDGAAHPGPAGILAPRPSVDQAEFETAIARILAAISTPSARRWRSTAVCARASRWPSAPSSRYRRGRGRATCCRVRRNSSCSIGTGACSRVR